MMIELKSSEKRKAKALLTEESPTFAHAIAEGIIEGNVYVDDFLTPTTALFRTSSGIYYVAGNVPDSGRSEWLHYLNEQRNGARFTVFSASEEWDDFLIGGLGDPLQQMERVSFFLGKEERDCGAAVDGVEKFSEDDFQKSANFTEKYADEYWGGTGRFLKNGFGFKVLHEGVIASECVSIFCSERFAEVDIATHPDYRGRGFAVRCASAFIAHAIENRLKPRWDCDRQNDASLRLAEKLGFRPVKTYSLFVGKP
ncbi:GNAT family N-acetyltransferase [Bacillus haynesii]|uniref:GNAT family N-acetyltransferase n=2 Tax=Bacillus haynesii TaxID=1925021 RepID=UPI0020CDEB31|nr:GNAT family N-acetyltransferase [Bacillus haynesii]MCY7815236.1 GNAT family N-acetyltransferase [Bacillus haynesii]MCY8224624.1 GNAT family N-acetyltransferase [Bacillus haynesii]MCY8663962.1 GNAT family N-acetyltransferase [Bacillus haynesii]MEC1472489.1 GNAT family N-acetyltransferase [Bacillus haynesii]MEC1484872.1 GNAT family N-acetyltransferase [Bacillus haynesii]